MRRSLIAALLPLLAAMAAPAQSEYHTEQLDALKIRFKVHNKLQPIPLKLGESNANHRANFQPKDPGDYIYGRYGTYVWDFDVLEFPKSKTDKPGKPAETSGPGGTTPSGEPAKDNAEKEPDPRLAKDWRTWVTEKDPAIKNRTFAVKGKAQKGRGKTPDYEWWEYCDSEKMTNGVEHFDQLWYYCAAVYDLPERQVALVVHVPVKRGTSADPKHMKWMQTMCQSLEPLEETSAGGAETATAKRDEFANTPERKQELEKAKANIANLKNWDYFTTPDYIVLYSWDPEKPKQKEALKFARDLSADLEEVRALYIRDYPPHDKMLKLYSVLRICDTWDEFQKYGDSPGGVIGWFSPRTKELVVFNDRYHEIGGAKGVKETTFHEGWHQYANTYFGEDVELHRWFDEGTGDYYGGFTKVGGKWHYEVDRGRYQDIRAQITEGNFIQTREIVSWNKDKFYGPRAPFHYAQGYSLIDFLRRGPEVLGRKFEPSWAGILDTYRKTMLETKNPKTAVEKAFAGVDWDAFQNTWIDWVKTKMK